MVSARPAVAPYQLQVNPGFVSFVFFVVNQRQRQAERLPYNCRGFVLVRACLAEASAKAGAFAVKKALAVLAAALRSAGFQPCRVT